MNWSAEESDGPRLVWLNLTVRTLNASPLDNDSQPCQLIDSGRNRLLIVVFTLIFIVSVIGNSLVIVTIVQNRWMRTITNLFLLNMAISDLLLTLICMPPTLTAMLFECFVWGKNMKWMCTLMSFLQPVSVAANANTLVAIALERYFALCRPLHSRQWQTKRNVVQILLVVWTAACVTSIPPTFVVEVIEIRPGQPNCRYNWPSPQAPLIYFIFLSQMVFTIPLIIMTVLYSLVIRSLWLGIKQHNESSEILKKTQSTCRHNSVEASNSSADGAGIFRHSTLMLKRLFPWTSMQSSTANASKTWPLNEAPTNVGNKYSAEAVSTVIIKDASTQNNSCRERGGHWSGAILRSTHTERNLLTKKRVIKMLAMIVIEFFVCWMPFYSYYLIVIIHPSLFDSSCHVAFLILAYLSTCTNPITYCFMNSKFRQAFLSVFGCHVDSKKASRKLRARSSGGVSRREAFKLIAATQDSNADFRLSLKHDDVDDKSSPEEYGTAKGDEVPRPDEDSEDLASWSNSTPKVSLQSENMNNYDRVWVSIQNTESNV